MNQPFDEELISAYLDDELSDEERRDVERLLAERPEAQRLLDELRGLRETLQSLPAYKLQDDFGAAVLRRAEREMLRGATPSNGAISSHGATAGEFAPASAEVVQSPAGSVQPAAEVERNWRRPAAWSLLAVSAALLLMFFDRQNREDAPRVAMNAEKRLEEGRKELGTDKQAASDEKNWSRVGPTDAEKRSLPPLGKAGDRDAVKDRAFANGGVMQKPGPSDAPAVALPKPQTANSSDNLIVAGQPSQAGNPMPLGNPMAVQNLGVPAAASIPPGNPMAVMNNVPATMPPVPPANMLAVENVDARREAPPALPPGGAVAGTQNPLSQQVLAGAGVGGAPLSGGAQQGFVDVTPLIQSNDYQRARTLVAEYEVARREVQDERQAGAALSQRMQSRALEAQVAQQQVPVQTKLGKSLDGEIDRSAAKTEQLLIVQCDVTPEALERGWAPILNREQIADLTTLYAGTTTINGLVQQSTGLQMRRQDNDANDEEFVYVVADSKQIEATLDALRRQSEYFLNVRVEPAPADTRQQAWRNRYSRVDDGAGANGLALKNAPAKFNDAPAGPSAAPAGPPVAAVASTPAPSASTTAKKAAEVSAERKQTAGTDDVAVAKTETAANAGQTLNEIPRLRESEGLQFGGGNGLATQLGDPAPNPAAGQRAATGEPALSYQYGGFAQSGYAQSNVGPLSRAQRLSRADALNGPPEALEQIVSGRANAKTAAPPIVARPAEIAPGNKAPESPVLGAVAATVTAPAVPNKSVPEAAEKLAGDGSEKAKPAAGSQFGGSQSNGSQASGGGVGGGGPRSGPPVQSPADVATQPIAQQTTQSDQPVWYGLPPDYHEALFIFRVVNEPTADAKPAQK